MVEPSDYIEYHLDLPQIPDNLLFTTVDEIRNNCEVIYDAYMYKTYKAPQELNDYLAPYMTDVLKLYLADKVVGCGTTESPKDTRDTLPLEFERVSVGFTFPKESSSKFGLTYTLVLVSVG